MKSDQIAAAELALASAKKKSIYAEVRLVEESSEKLAAQDESLQPPQRSAKSGLAVRLWKRGWGFAATCSLEPDAVQRAVEEAAALTGFAGGSLAPPSPARAQWQGECKLDPFALPLSWKTERLLEVAAALEAKAVTAREAAFIFIRKKQLYLNSQGARVYQEHFETGYSLKAVAQGAGRAATRSYPNCLGGGFAQAGFEFIQKADLIRQAERIAKEAEELLTAPPAPCGKLDLVLCGSQLALQLHETFGHALDLGRALGCEESLAGGSFLTPEKLGEEVASHFVNITADSTAPGGPGSFGFDDEGTPAQKLPLVRSGRVVGFLTSREHNLTGKSGGAMRAASWQDQPLIRMTNVNMEPGQETLQELIAGIELGLLLDVPNSWSVDQNRLNFHFAQEAGYLIKRGRIQGLVAGPTYWGDARRFWRNCDGVSNSALWQTVPNCGKGLPLQVVRVGHKVPAARFREVDVAFGGRP